MLATVGGSGGSSWSLNGFLVFFFFGAEGKGKGSLILQVGDFLIASKAC